MLERSRKYKYLGDRLLRTRPELADIRAAGVRIAYLASDKEKEQNHKIIFGDCTKVPEKYAWCCHYDFIITIYEPNIMEFTMRQVEALVFHELLHCGIDFDAMEPSFYVVPHDIEEFYAVINEFGQNWQRSEADA